jgi:hypothetical protein
MDEYYDEDQDDDDDNYYEYNNDENNIEHCYACGVEISARDPFADLCLECAIEQGKVPGQTKSEKAMQGFVLFDIITRFLGGK